MSNGFIDVLVILSFNTEQSANSFDWNGVHITDKADNVAFSNFLISYSVFGLKCEIENVSIDNGVFFQNGQFHFTINEKLQQVQEGSPFSYNVQEKKDVRVKSKSFIKTGIPTILGSSGIASTIFFALSVENYSDLEKEFGQTTDFEKQEDLKDKGREELIKSVVFGVISLTTIPIAIFLYLKNNKQPEKKSDISVNPAIDQKSTGVLLAFRF